MRRPTLIMIVALLIVIAVAAVAQVLIATDDRPAYRGPTSPGQLPSVSPTPGP
jgi:hypothetical protein